MNSCSFPNFCKIQFLQGLDDVKIGFCNILYSKKNDRGGLGAHIHDLSQQLAEYGHEVTILTSGPEKQYLEGNVRVVQLGKVSRFSGGWQLLTPFFWFRRVSYMFKLTRYIRRNHFDVLESAEGGAEQLLVILQHPCAVVTKLHGNFRNIYNRRYFSRVVEFFERIAAAKSDGVYTSSVSYAETISSEYKIPLKTIRIIPYGIRIGDLCGQTRQLEAFVKQRKTVASRTVLLSVGSSPVRKGATLFLEAASILEDQGIQFFLLSSDNSFNATIRIPENLINLGNLDRSRFYSVLSDADIVVFPSHFESFGIAAYEAMLLGKIVIISKNVPLEGSARNYNRCFVLETLTSRALANTIRDVFAGIIKFPPPDPETLKQMKEEYDIKNIAGAVLSFYEEILASGKDCASGRNWNAKTVTTQKCLRNSRFNS